MLRTLHLCLVVLLALSFTLTACDSSREEEEGEDTDPAVGCNDAGAITLQVPPTATYLRTSANDEAAASQPVRLAGIDLQPGDRIRAERLGEYQFRDIHPDSVRYGIVAVFSSDTQLLGRDVLNRVPGAIDAGEDAVTPFAFRDNVPTDIPEDFAVFEEQTLTVPGGAEYLFLSPFDNAFNDNLDDDGDFRLCITHVDE